MRARLKDHVAAAGSTIAPTIAPYIANTNQLHGAPVSVSAAHLPIAPTILATSTPIMPPPANPAMAVKHPTAK
jgi:hypothetical protein